MKRNILFLIVASIMVYIASTGSGCEDNPTGPTIITDTNVHVYSGRVITGYMSPTSMSGINLFTGTIVTSESTQKDILLKDLDGTNQDWFLRDGSLSLLDLPAGSETLFKMLREYDDLSKERFDTISRIKNIGSTTVQPTTEFFNITSTAQYSNPQYLNPPLSNRMVLSFYLKGKYENGVTPNKVWGLIHLEKMETVGGEVKLTVNVKINTKGENQFLRERTVTGIEQ
ncbi:MAG TPA: hypothetical protein VHP32_03480 [Ignavibacteria bacterium]|nr:hypothetical protein [Ignavibacteria bacterium]